MCFFFLLSFSAFETPPTTDATASVLCAANEKELNSQKAYNSQRPTAEWEIHDDKDDEDYSKAQQANQITLQQIKNEQQRGIAKATRVNKKIHQDDGDDDDEVREDGLESNENEHLLGGQEQQQVTKNSATVTAARLHFKQTSTATSDGVSGKYNRYRENEEGKWKMLVIRPLKCVAFWLKKATINC